jgi:hypothetical protein
MSSTVFPSILTFSVTLSFRTLSEQKTSLLSASTPFRWPWSSVYHFFLSATLHIHTAVYFECAFKRLYNHSSNFSQILIRKL